MRKVGILYDKQSKQVMLLPKEVKRLSDKQVNVFVLSGAGECANIADSNYEAAGAKVCKSWKEVVDNADVILKANAFNKQELSAMEGKIAITMVNFLVNVEMIYHMLQNKVTGLEWKALTNQSKYVLFDEIEQTKASLIIKTLKETMQKGLVKNKKHPVVYPKDPKIFILNAGPLGVELTKQALACGWKVTLADADASKLMSLSKQKELAAANFVDAGYETITKLFAKHQIFVNTAINPIDVTKPRITKEIATTMPAGSLLVDAACEFGYAFHFVKKFADKEIKWNKLDHCFYLAHEDFNNLLSQFDSEIISNKSFSYLMSVIEKGVDDNVIWKITNTQNGKVVNARINGALRLY